MTYPLRRKKSWLGSLWPVIAAYAGISLMCLGGYTVLALADPKATGHDRVEAYARVVRGPLGAGSLAIAALAVLLIAAGIVFPRNPLARLLGAMALALWFLIGLFASTSLGA